MMEKSKRFNLVATTLQGLEGLLANELRSIGGNDIKEAKRAVYFTGDNDLIYKANLRLRTALKILKPINSFSVRNEDDLYRGVKNMDWPSFFDSSKTFSVDASVSSQYFTHSLYALYKTKDAIVDKFRESSGKRPDVDTVDPDFRIHLHISQDTCNISLNSSGDALNKRGYRPLDAEAPINESLAAGLILLTQWPGLSDFYDPMCGSGTIAIEAALIAMNIAPGLLRENFGFMNWPDYDPDLFDVIREATISKIKPYDFKIYASDISDLAVKQTRESAAHAKLEDVIQVNKTDFQDLIPFGSRGIMVMNPPYDLRLTHENIGGFYQQIGDKLKRHFQGFNAWVLSGNPDAMKQFGLRPSKKFRLKNGPLDVLFAGYELYPGSRKPNKRNLDNEEF